ncbi:hypothetical protein VFPPC_11329 [Pochonia chlamydosporia 170]|uniref:Uncharacterized protein n=1 Tax=Pochonia chlamydosporia 170 TaxID=1380566 RepID=A0A179EY85_METCM|nr:hypothetical protein VFPPC_11329 [Pochonia chlamydosporia 170]OAQ58155.1 hypothetical protein VFPPC_11329 [Pochonia chlamydosporia 170]
MTEKSKYWCLAIAAWANPGSVHNPDSTSTEYASDQLAIAAAKNPQHSGIALLNEGDITARLQMLVDSRGFESMLNLRQSPTTDDLENLVNIASHLKGLDFPEYEDREEYADVMSPKQLTECLSSILIGRMCKLLRINPPETLSSTTLYSELLRLYTVASCPSAGLPPPPPPPLYQVAVQGSLSQGIRPAHPFNPGLNQGKLKILRPHTEQMQRGLFRRVWDGIKKFGRRGGGSLSDEHRRRMPTFTNSALRI